MLVMQSQPSLFWSNWSHAFNPGMKLCIVEEVRVKGATYKDACFSAKLDGIADGVSCKGVDCAEPTVVGMVHNNYLYPDAPSLTCTFAST